MQGLEFEFESNLRWLRVVVATALPPTTNHHCHIPSLIDIIAFKSVIREIDILRDLKHPNVVTFIGASFDSLRGLLGLEVAVI